MKTNRMIVGVDVAKHVFQLYWVDVETGEEMNLRLARAKFLRHFGKQNPPKPGGCKQNPPKPGGCMMYRSWWLGKAAALRSSSPDRRINMPRRPTICSDNQDEKAHCLT